jgi:hypothetical protein
VSIFDRIVEYSNISKPSERVPKEDGGMLVMTLYVKELV